MHALHTLPSRSWLCRMLPAKCSLQIAFLVSSCLVAAPSSPGHVYRSLPSLYAQPAALRTIHCTERALTALPPSALWPLQLWVHIVLMAFVMVILSAIILTPRACHLHCGRLCGAASFIAGRWEAPHLLCPVGWPWPACALPARLLESHRLQRGSLPEAWYPSPAKASCLLCFLPQTPCPLPLLLAPRQ